MRDRRRRTPRRTRWRAPTRIASGVSYWTSAPSFMIAMRSPIRIASSMSWVTKTIVFLRPWRIRRNSSCRCARVIGSMAPNGSSISITGGSAASARATPTRCFWPARELARKAVAVGRRFHADQCQQLVDARGDLAGIPAEELRHRRDVLGDRPVREQPDLLDHVTDMAAERHRVDVHHVAPVHGDRARVGLDHPVDDPHRRRLAAAGGPDQHADLRPRPRRA